MSVRIAFLGFRHVHIDDLYEFARTSPRVSVAGAAEDDSDAAVAAKQRGIELTDASVDALFARTADFDAVAIGDYYGRRGALAIRALESGKHVIADKPLCTSPAELTEIDRLRRKNRLSVGCMLNNRDSAQFRTIKRLYGQGVIGSLQTITFSGQHPLLYGTRPSWYFEEGKHGGTINDIAIHAVDVVPWIFDQAWSRVVAARVWNTRLSERPHFQVGAQMMLELADGTGVLGDVSYLSPDSQGYTVPQYWRYTIHGTGGIIETGMKLDDVRVWADGAESVEVIQPDAGRENGVYEDFLNEVEGKPELSELTTDTVIESSRAALTVQHAADTETFPQDLA